MNEVKSIELTELKNRTQSGVIFYTSMPYGMGSNKKMNHCEIFSLNNLFRVMLNESSFTLIYKQGGKIKFSVPNDFDIQPLADLVEIRHKAGLKVVEHFGKIRS